MMLNKKSSRKSAWKALYVIPLVGISLAATAETKVDYRYEGRQPEAVADTLKGRVVKVHGTTDGKDSENWYKVEHKDTASSAVNTISKPKSAFTQKNLYEGKCIVDKENNILTLIYFDTAGKEHQIQYTGLDLNKDIYMHNGVIVTKEMYTKATKDDPDVVIIVSYLKDNNRVMAAITKNAPYATGTINVSHEQEGLNLKSSIKVYDAEGDNVDVDMNDLVIILNGERMPAGFDMNTIDAETITSIEVLKTEEALEEYDTDKGVIVITTGQPKNNQDAMKVMPFQSVAHKPEFNGGDANEFSKWIAENMKYPENCLQAKVQGRVMVEFTVTETGKVSDVRILRSVNEDLDKEAVRVVAQSPLWTPGRDENGDAVRVKYVFPVIFKL